MNILTLLNNVTDTNTLNKGIDIAKQKVSSIGLNLSFTQYNTNKKFTSVALADNPNMHVVNGTDIFQEAKTFNSPFDVALLIFDWTKISPQPTNPCDTGMSISIPMEWYSTYPEVFAQFFLHELCHYFSAKTGKVDLTHLLTDGNLQKQYADLYLKWKQLQPIDYYVYLLSTMTQPTIPTVTITRGKDDGKETLGVLTTGGFACKTLEPSATPSHSGVYRIPSGTYKCLWGFQHDLNEYHYLLQGVPGFTGVFIHEGNFIKDTLGCIILGDTIADINADGEPDVLHSRITLATFEKLMNKLPFTLVIQ